MLMDFWSYLILNQIDACETFLKRPKPRSQAIFERTANLEIIHIDVCVAMHGGFIYFTDDLTR